MKYRSQLLAMQRALTETLPCDTTIPLEAWFALYDTRLRDLGYDSEARRTQINALQVKVQQRQEASHVLAQTLSAKCKSRDPDVQSAVLAVLADTGLYIGLHKDRNFARYAKHLRYIRDSPEAQWGAVFEAYRKFFRRLLTGMSRYRPFVNMLCAAPLDDINAFADVFGYTYWSADPRDRDTFRFYAESSMVRCPIGGELFPRDVGRSVVTGPTTTELVHPTVAEDTTRVRRDISGAYVLISAVEWVPLADGGFAWRERNESSGRIYRDEYTDTWCVSNPNSRVGSYHGAPREWRHRRPGTLAGHIGVELECGWRSSDLLRRFIRRYVDDRGRFHSGRPFLIEGDSSLSSVPNGVEIISEPLLLASGYQAEDAPWRWLLGVLSQSGCQGWPHRRYAGIHVNMDSTGRTLAEITRYVMFLHNIPAIAKFVSGRTRIYGADESATAATEALLNDFARFSERDHYDGGFVHYTPDTLARVSGISRPVTQFSSATVDALRRLGKYQPVNIRENGVLETRIFGSNIRYTGFMACVELCVSGMEFVCGLERDTDVFDPELSRLFRNWLSENSEKYPNLIARIGALETSTKPVIAARPLVELTA